MIPQRDKISISWSEISDPRVDESLRAAQAQVDAAPDPSQSAPVIGEPHLLEQRKTSLWYNSIVFMTLFGLLGGILGWACGEILHFRPDARSEARDWINARNQVERSRTFGVLSDKAADSALAEIDKAATNNPYYLILKDTGLDPAERDRRLGAVRHGDEWKELIANTLFYSLSGMMISVCLAIAEPVVDRNTQAAVVNGSVGAIAGLLGGVVVSLLVGPVYRGIEGDPTAASTVRLLVARMLTWGMLGLFLTIGPGLVMRNGRKLLVGLAGGLVGGLIGGALYEMVGQATGSGHVSRLVAIVTVGAVAGLGTGLIENVARSGWLRVTAGLIAGKQFILYRNPTFIGSSLQNTIYLFQDPQVGRRHAAIHIVRGGFELENFPLGGPTFVNGHPITRRRLHDKDRIQIGATTFVFQEKTKSAAV